MPDDQTTNPLPRQPIVLSMSVDDYGSCESLYRLLMGDQVKEIAISAGTFDFETLKFPLKFLPRLPDNEKWNVAHFSRDEASSNLRIFFSNWKIPGLEHQWHHTLVDHRDLEMGEWVYKMTFKVISHSTILPRVNMMAKIAHSESELPFIEQESSVYQLLEGTRFALRFLGHIHENGRIIGFLLERMIGQSVTSIDVEDWQEALREFHTITGLLLGKVDKNAFVMTRQ
ncbi:alpha-galactosidase a [Fusarium langsethiae]|uniref:Alpha-galactosidase a n=1 Tax=Fusarium langsethiae TaxID=179993 RepID=A0A0N0DD89_FUSLA|nr:alpha-galactosidase a [Fusarium langsethiae]GKU05060.1 unnamed protein product [Fusarium langsethiae]